MCVADVDRNLVLERPRLQNPFKNDTSWIKELRDQTNHEQSDVKYAKTLWQRGTETGLGGLEERDSSVD